MIGPVMCDGQECELVRVSDPQPWHPKWELMAPDGYEFSGGESSLLFMTEGEAREAAGQESLFRVGGNV